MSKVQESDVTYIYLAIKVERDGDDIFTTVEVEDGMVAKDLLDVISDWLTDNPDWYADKLLPIPTPEEIRETQECEKFHENR